MAFQKVRCFCHQTRKPIVFQFTLQREWAYCEILRDVASILAKKGLEEMFLCASRGFQRGDRVLTTGLGMASSQPTVTCVKLAFSESGHSNPNLTTATAKTAYNSLYESHLWYRILWFAEVLRWTTCSEPFHTIKRAIWTLANLFRPETHTGKLFESSKMFTVVNL